MKPLSLLLTALLCGCGSNIAITSGALPHPASEPAGAAPATVVAGPADAGVAGAEGWAPAQALVLAFAWSQQLAVAKDASVQLAAWALLAATRGAPASAQGLVLSGLLREAGDAGSWSFTPGESDALVVVPRVGPSTTIHFQRAEGASGASSVGDFLTQDHALAFSLEDGLGAAVQVTSIRTGTVWHERLEGSEPLSGGAASVRVEDAHAENAMATAGALAVEDDSLWSGRASLGPLVATFRELRHWESTTDDTGARWRSDDTIDDSMVTDRGTVAFASDHVLRAGGPAGESLLQGEGGLTFNGNPAGGIRSEVLSGSAILQVQLGEETALLLEEPLGPGS